jgi:urease accessory protein
LSRSGIATDVAFCDGYVPAPGFQEKDAMLRIERVLGSRLEPGLSEQLHRLEHRGALDVVTIAVADLPRRRLLTTTRGGEELAIALPRDQKLFDGAVLLLDDIRAIVVRAAGERWLRLEPRSIEDAIEVGYHVGNLHWRVRFDGKALLVALEGRPEDYVARLEGLIEAQRVSISVLEEGAEGRGALLPDYDFARQHPHSHDHSH